MLTISMFQLLMLAIERQLTYKYADQLVSTLADHKHAVLIGDDKHVPFVNVDKKEMTNLWVCKGLPHEPTAYAPTNAIMSA